MGKVLKFIWESIVGILAILGIASLAEAAGLFDPPPPRRHLPVAIEAGFASTSVTTPLPYLET